MGIPNKTYDLTNFAWGWLLSADWLSTTCASLRPADARRHRSSAASTRHRSPSPTRRRPLLPSRARPRRQLNYSIGKFNIFKDSGNLAVILRKIRQLFTESHHSLDRFYHFLKILAKFRRNVIKIWLQNGKIQ